MNTSGYSGINPLKLAKNGLKQGSVEGSYEINLPQIKMFIITACVIMILYFIFSIVSSGIAQKAFNDNKDKIDQNEFKYKIVKFHLITSSIFLGIVILFLGAFIYKSKDIKLY